MQLLQWAQVCLLPLPQHPNRLGEMLVNSPGRAFPPLLPLPQHILQPSENVPGLLLCATHGLVLPLLAGAQCPITDQDGSSSSLSRLIGLRFQIWQWQWVPWWVPSMIPSQWTWGICPLASSIRWKCWSPLCRWGQQRWGGCLGLCQWGRCLTREYVPAWHLHHADNEDTRKCKARELARKNDTDFAAWRDKLIRDNGVAGIQEWDKTVHDYADPGNKRPKNPDTIGPPVSYMKECGVFQPLPSMPWILWGYVIFIPQTHPACLRLHLQNHLPPWTISTISWFSQSPGAGHISLLCLKVAPLCLWGYYRNCIHGTCLYVFPSSCQRKPRTGTGHGYLCCPFCAYTIQNDPAYLNHIINTHYHTNFACGTCLGAVTMSGQQMKRHISECPGLAALPEKSLQESAQGEHSPKKCAHRSSSSKSKHGGSKNKQSCHSGKSQPGEATSQENSQTSDRCLTHAWPAWVRRAQLDPQSITLVVRRKRRRHIRRRSPASDLMHFLLGMPWLPPQPLITQSTFTHV